MNQSEHATSSSSTLASSHGNPSSLHQVSRGSRHSRRNRPSPSHIHGSTTISITVPPSRRSTPPLLQHPRLSSHNSSPAPSSTFISVNNTTASHRRGDAHQPWQLHAHGPAPHLHCIHQHRSRPWQQHSPSSATANTNPIAAPAPQHCAAVKREETPTRTRFHHLHCSTSLKNMNQSRHQQPWHPSTMASFTAPTS